jgi:hypothetical protein
VALELIFQEKVTLKKRKIRRNAKKCLTKMDEDGDLENGIRVEMDYFDLIVVKGPTEEITGREAESALKKGRKHHNFIGIGCGKVFTSDRAPLQHGTI